MRKMITWKKQFVVKCAAVLLFVLLTVWMFGLLSSITRIKAEELALTPLIADACGWELYTVENGSRREISSEDAFSLEAGRVFYLSRTLTKEQENAGYTFLMLDILRPYAVFLDGDLLYTNCRRTISVLTRYPFRRIILSQTSHRERRYGVLCPGIMPVKNSRSPRRIWRKQQVCPASCCPPMRPGPPSRSQASAES